MAPKEHKQLLSSTKCKVPASVQGITELFGRALSDVDAQCCCQAAWNPGQRQALGSIISQATRNNPFLVSWGMQVEETSGSCILS